MSPISLFEEKQVRQAWNAETQKWQFAIVDIIAILTDSPNPQVYWRVMKKRLADEGNETVTNCHGLKMTAADGKQRMTDVADTEQLLRLIQSVPSPQAEPFKCWLAKVGYERLEEIENPEPVGKRMPHHRRRYPLRGWDILSPSFLQVAHSSEPRAAWVLGIETQSGHKISTSENFQALTGSRKRITRRNS